MRYSLLAAALSVASAAPVTAQSPQGVWKVVEWRVGGGPDAGHHTSDVQPGLIVITARHYSTTAVQAFKPRPQLSESSTVEERAKVWDAFVANAGTYQIKDSTFSYTPSVAKNPGVMSGDTYKVGIRVRADSMWLTLKADDGTENWSKWVRIERLAPR